MKADHQMICRAVGDYGLTKGSYSDGIPLRAQIFKSSLEMEQLIVVGEFAIGFKYCT